MNPLIEIANEFELKQQELKVLYYNKAKSICSIINLESSLNNITNDVKYIDTYNKIYSAYQQMIDDTVKDVLMEKLQEIYKHIYEIQVNIAKTLQYVNPNVISIDTIQTDLKKLSFTETLFSNRSNIYTYLEEIKKIHNMNDTIFGAPHSTEHYDDSIIKMSNDEIKQHNTNIAKKVQTTAQEYNDEFTLFKKTIPNTQLRVDPVI